MWANKLRPFINVVLRHTALVKPAEFQSLRPFVSECALSQKNGTPFLKISPTSEVQQLESVFDRVL